MQKPFLWILCVFFFCHHAWADTGIFVGGSFGNTTLSDKVPDNQNVGDIDIGADDTGYKIFTGVRLGDLSVEASYVDFGGPSRQGTSVDLTALDAFGVMDFSLGPISLFGKIGFVRWDYDLDNISSNFKRDGTDPAYGLGARMTLGSLALRVEYELFDIGAVDDLYLFSAGVSYTLF